MIAEVCDIEEQFYDWELEAYSERERRNDVSDIHRTRIP
jgi:hypothetical protein